MKRAPLSSGFKHNHGGFWSSACNAASQEKNEASADMDKSSTMPWLRPELEVLTS